MMMMMMMMFPESFPDESTEAVHVGVWIAVEDEDFVRMVESNGL